MKTTIRAAAVVVTLFAASAAQAQEAVQWRVQDGGNGHWYAFKAKSTVICWHDARALCELQGGHLATITSSAENQLLLTLTIPNNPGGIEGGPYIGGTCEGLPWGQWYWITGEPFSYTSWMPGAPNGSGGVTEPYLHFWRWSNLGWNDQVDCGGLMFSYLIEWSADCNNDGIVDYGQCRDGTLPDYNGNNVPDCCEQDGSCIGGDYPVQWREGDRANGHWYGVVRTPGLPWSQARAEAVSVGGDLASAPRAEVNAFIGRLIRPYSPWGPGYWLGGRKVDGEWAWVNGESWSFVSWGSAAVGCNNQPDGRDAVDIYCFDAAGVPRWSDDHFQWPNAVGFVIEWSADCNNDGIVDKGQILKGQLVDADANGVPDVCEVDPCPGDITNGGTVDATDLSIVLAAWGTNGQGEFQADIDNSGLVDGGDLALVLGGWGPCPQ